MAATAEAPGWTSQFRVLVNALDLDLHDVRECAECHLPGDYGPPQTLGKTLRASGSNGVLYRSVRAPGGECIGIFWPDLIEIPVQGDHFDFHWDGTRVDRVRNCSTSAIFAL
eukprot:jgi/Tetstr1/453017/TSEL_040053.t1